MADYDNISRLYDSLYSARSYIDTAREKIRALYTIIEEADNLMEIIRNEIKYWSKVIQDRIENETTRTETDRSGYQGGTGLVGRGSKEENPRIYEEAAHILWNEVLIAVETNKEYNHDFFLQKLRRVVYSDELFYIRPHGKYVATIQIRMNEVAGTLEDYAMGIKQTRINFGVKAFHKLTNKFWQEKLYDTARGGLVLRKRRKKQGSNRKSMSGAEKTQQMIAKYWATMNSRMEESGKEAPFWELLDQGTQPMSSDREGGMPYPLAKPTNFVNKALTKIKLMVRGEYIKLDPEIEYRRPDVEVERSNIRNLEYYVENLREIIKQAYEDIDSTDTESEDIEALTRYLVDVLEREIKNIDVDKIRKMVVGLRNNDLSDLSITAAGTYEVTASHAEIRTRVSVNRIKNITGYDF